MQTNVNKTRFFGRKEIVKFGVRLKSSLVCHYTYLKKRSWFLHRIVSTEGCMGQLNAMESELQLMFRVLTLRHFCDSSA